MQPYLNALTAALVDWQFYASLAGFLLLWWLLSMAVAQLNFKPANPTRSAAAAMLIALLIVVVLSGGLGYFWLWPADWVRVVALSVFVLIIAGAASLTLPARK